MRKYIWIIVGTLLFAGCHNNEKTVENNSGSAIDISDIIEAYRNNGCSSEVSSDVLFQFLFPYEDKDTSNTINIEIYDDESFTLDLPDYRNSEHPFLSQAVDIFNCCLIANGVWSNFEVWYRFVDLDGQSVIESTRRINLDVINDKELLKAATVYRDGIADLLARADETTAEDTPFVLKDAFFNVINDKWYKYYDEPDSLMMVLTHQRDSIYSAVDDSYQQYLQADANTRLGLMLNSLNKCRSFDEQCALFCSWANSEESSSEDLWIIAVGTRLMESGQYYPFLYEVWLIWRPLCQQMYFGMSMDSTIPNKFYNKYRALCFISCLKHIANHPDDLPAINCASDLAGRSNINRYGQFHYGNQAAMEALEFLPNRYKGVFDSDEELEKNE